MLFRPTGGSITNPMTTTGDIIYSSDNSGTAARLGAGTDGKVLTMASGIPAWSNASAAWNYVTKTATYNPAVINDWIVCSSSSFAITLPTAVGVSGQSIIVEHAGTSLSQAYTLNTTSSQTITGPTGAVAGGNYVLRTTGETVWLMSDGAGWHVVYHYSSTDWTDAGANTVTATTTNPTKASGITVDKIYWRRIGKNAEFRVEYAQSNTTSAAAGSGDYLWAIPANMTIDTATITPFTTVIGVAAATLTNAIGSGNARLNTLSNVVSVVLYDTTKVRFYFINPTNGGFICSTSGAGFDTANFSVNVTYSVPMVGWQP